MTTQYTTHRQTITNQLHYIITSCQALFFFFLIVDERTSLLCILPRCHLQLGRTLGPRVNIPLSWFLFAVVSPQLACAVAFPCIFSERTGAHLSAPKPKTRSLITCASIFTPMRVAGSCTIASFGNLLQLKFSFNNSIV